MKYRSWELEEAKEHIENQTFTLDENGVARWKSNGKTIMDDMGDRFEILELAGFSRINTSIEHDKETTAALEQYRQNTKNKTYSEEEINGMRNVYGKGTIVVDMLNGKKIKL